MGDNGFLREQVNILTNNGTSPHTTEVSKTLGNTETVNGWTPAPQQSWESSQQYLDRINK